MCKGNDLMLMLKGDVLMYSGTAQQVFEWGAKEECVKENFGGGAGGGACLCISIQFL